MDTQDAKAPCEILPLLQSKLDAIASGLQKAEDILARSTDSPDSMRRRRQTVAHWQREYRVAYDRLEAHAREHGCK